MLQLRALEVDDDGSNAFDEARRWSDIRKRTHKSPTRPRIDAYKIGVHTTEIW